MNGDPAARDARRVGLITLATGCALVAAPGPAGTLLGVDDPRSARLIGAADLALVPGLVAGRPRWLWMAVRAAINLPTAAVLARTGGRSGRWSAATLLALTVSDARIAKALYDAGR